ncbi:MAG: outer membrane protein assembly factor BamD, partial [bacterium]|nr:outer membrane protein assembly factor BamD [bacterium]
MVIFVLRRHAGPVGLAALLVILFLGYGCSLKNKKAEPVPTARDLYTEGTKLVGKKKYEEAREFFNKAKGMGTDPEVELLAQIAVADSYFEEKEYAAARGLYEELYKLHAGGKVADYLLYRVAECSFWQIDTIDRDTTSAKAGLKVFNQLIAEYPESEYVAPSRLRIKEITTFL